jgi:endo-1,4-beta-xylanase
MKKYFLKQQTLVIVAAIAIASCKKTPDTGILATGSFGDTTGALKSATDMPIGTAVGYADMMIDPVYATVVKRDFNAVTVENELKHSSIVQNNGNYDYTKADAVVAASSGLQIHGHTLGWHSQQNATYLKSYSGLTIPAATELLPSNADFESGASNWSIFNTNGATITFVTGDAANAHGGTSYMKVVNPTAQTGNQWKVQVAGPLVATTPGTQYTFSYWVKAASAGGSIRLSTADQSGANAQYQGDQTIGTTYQLISFAFTANSAQTRVLFDMGQVANTYYIDDASYKQVINAPSGSQVNLKLDTALNKFITTTVTRYKNSIHSWDVINELFADDGSLRTNANTNITPSDVFVWSNYLGRDYGYKAFKYAEAADPTAALYINDYGLESNARKLDSLISYVKEIKLRGAKVDGIGTQMHIAWNTPYAGIDAMFQKLAVTGLKIKISELDVKTVQSSAAGAPTPQLNGYQAAMVRYVVQSYLKNIPKAQQGGITLWGVTDKYSWLYNNGKEFPLLYDNNYNKKPSYSAFLQALKGQ